jgi:hypothetical protein
VNQHVKDEGDLRRYYSQIPHLADDELDPYEMRLYVHYKRVCGQGGECFETTESTATICHMSERKVQKTRQSLIDKKWIHAELKGKRGFARMHITLIDRWNDNYKRFSNEATSTPAPGAPVHDVHPLPPQEMHPTPAPGAPKRRTKKEEQTDSANGTRPPSPHQGVITAYVEALGYTPPNMGKEAKAAKWLVEHEYTPEQVAACYRHMKKDRFWSDKFLSLQKVSEQIAEFCRRNRPTAPATRYNPVTKAQEEKVGDTWYAKASQGASR